MLCGEGVPGVHKGLFRGAITPHAAPSLFQRRRDSNLRLGNRRGVGVVMAVGVTMGVVVGPGRGRGRGARAWAGPWAGPWLWAGPWAGPDCGRGRERGRGLGRKWRRVQSGGGAGAAVAGPLRGRRCRVLMRRAIPAVPDAAPWEERRRGPGEPPRGRRARPPRRSWRVLAERTQSAAPVGVWVESAPVQQSPAFASVLRVEEELWQQQREKAERLRRFQDEVRRRVNRQVRMRRRQELHESCEVAERESCAAMQCSVPWRNTCLSQSHPTRVICGPGAGSSPARWEGTHGEPFQQQAAELSRAVRQVRRRLASCRTVCPGAEPPLLPGGNWRQEKPEPCPAAAVPSEDESEELLLVGHHDLPAELQERGTAGQDGDFCIKIEFPKVRDGSVKDLNLPKRLRTDYQPALVLWAGVDQEETRKQQQSEFLRCRRLFMAIERERVKDQQRQRERQHRVAQIKRQKENQRRMEEQRMRDLAEQRKSSLGEGAWEALAQLELQERRVRDRWQRDKEHVRYVEALKAQMREKIKLCNIDLPPLCSCGSDFWDSHPDTCANNCVFYKNHKAYSQALRSVISSCAPLATQPLQDLAALYACSVKRL
ncbi:coiled-coil domain-containing protein 15 [Pithys albifrons albifrons]|uniref:coiled-coil domain-containing protein 15 n=1 Tax=Pithys albifrons albifrons TaxID=3385563 RepID=UPI003A5D0C2D